MSIGNLKDTGNQGNNLPFQWKVLQGLQSIISSTFNVAIKAPLGQQNNDNSVSTVLSNEQANVLINTAAKRFTAADDNATSFSNTIFSISFASVGTADARISFDGGTLYLILKPGETLNLDAGGVMNYYDGALITWDTTTNAGSSLLVAVNYI
jgi:hypothetical protein